MEFEYEGSTALSHIKREFIAGGFAGSVGIFIGFPFDLIKVKLQAFPGAYASAVDCFRKSVKADGWLGLYSGCLPPIVLQGEGPAAVLSSAPPSDRWLLCRDDQLTALCWRVTSHESPSTWVAGG